jgi:hypothetical protein
MGKPEGLAHSGRTDPVRGLSRRARMSSRIRLLTAQGLWSYNANNRRMSGGRSRS